MAGGGGFAIFRWDAKEPTGLPISLPHGPARCRSVAIELAVVVECPAKGRDALPCADARQAGTFSHDVTRAPASQNTNRRSGSLDRKGTGHFFSARSFKVHRVVLEVHHESCAEDVVVSGTDQVGSIIDGAGDVVELHA